MSKKMDTDTSTEASCSGDSTEGVSGQLGLQQDIADANQLSGIFVRGDTDNMDSSEEESLTFLALLPSTPVSTDSEPLDLDDSSESQESDILPPLPLPLPRPAPPLLRREGALDVHSLMADADPAGPSISPSAPPSGNPKPDIHVTDKQISGLLDLAKEKKNRKKAIPDMMHGTGHMGQALEPLEEQESEEFDTSPPACEVNEGITGGLRGERSDPTMLEAQVLRGPNPQWQRPQVRPQTAHPRKSSRRYWDNYPRGPVA